jgi:hypothetical protein
MLKSYRTYSLLIVTLSNALSASPKGKITINNGYTYEFSMVVKNSRFVKNSEEHFNSYFLNSSLQKKLEV